MSWNGSGTFSRKTTTVSPATSGTTVDSADMNSYTTDVTGGINACRAKNGENAATANLPMGGFKHTNVADGTARTEYSSVGQGQDGSTQYAADTGAADAYVVTLSPAVTSNVVGRKTSFKATNTNTGASTLNLNAIGAESIKRYDGDALSSGDITATRIYTVTWDGTNYILDNQMKQGVFVNNSDGSPSISSTVFDILSDVAAATYESVGPTTPWNGGTAADNVWTGLDSVAVGADWVEVMLTGSANKVSTTLFLTVRARETGSSITSEINDIGKATFSDGDSDSKVIDVFSRSVKIPVDSSGRFDIYYTSSAGATVTTMNMYITGYGWN